MGDGMVQGRLANRPSIGTWSFELVGKTLVLSGAYAVQRAI